MRTVIVGTDTDGVSGTSGTLQTTLVSGDLPVEPVTARVLTDKNCAPDDAGISHCLNDLAMPDDSVTTVRHHHRMSVTPCLSPGEQVHVESEA